MIILTGQEIQDALFDCDPIRIAVAYIGEDWCSFIFNIDTLKEVIVSPTFGTNPKAVVSLANHIGWENLYFLNVLHAKMYIGAKSSVVGSSNLTLNGLSGNDFLEVCVEVKEETSTKKLEAIFDEFKKKAITQYPTTKSKKERLVELERIWYAAEINRIIPKSRKIKTAFQHFELLSEDHFYVCWYNNNSDINYSADYILIESRINDEMHFAKKDNVKKNKWTLSWRVTNSWLPHRTASLGWVYIHDIYDNGIIDKDYDYPKCAIERSDCRKPNPPFEITPEVESAFKKAVQLEEIAKYLIQEDNDIFNLAFSAKGLSLLIDKMKQILL